MLVPSLLAYIDPMSGAIVLQVILAGMIGCAAFFRRSIWAVISKVFCLKRSHEDPEAKKPEANDS